LGLEPQNPTMTASRSAPRPRRVTPLDPRRLELVTAYVEANLAEAISLGTLARLTAISRFYFAKRFKAATGLAPYAFVVARRMARARELLRNGGATVAEAGQAVGYSQLSHFRRQFAAHWGEPPGGVAPDRTNARIGPCSGHDACPSTGRPGR
jgi:AraC family transcriptional regulator